MKLHVDETRHPKSASNAVGKTHRDDEQPQIFTFLSIPNDLNDCHLLEEEENEFKLLGITSIEEKITVLRKFMYLFRPPPPVLSRKVCGKKIPAVTPYPFLRECQYLLQFLSFKLNGSLYINHWSTYMLTFILNDPPCDS